MPSPAAKPATQTAPSQSLFSSPEKRTFVLCLLLVVVTLALYNSTSSHPFVNYDDDRYVTENPHVRVGLTWDSVHWAFTSFDQANWHPLTWLSHELDCQLFKLNPAGHHYTNVLLQALNVVLLFLMLQWATGFTWRSLMVALLFAVHPVNVESVAWVSERKNLLSMMFLLLAMAAYGRYVRKPSVKTYLTVLLAFACGLMAKPMVITLPFLLLLWDYWPLRRMRSGSNNQPGIGSLILEKVPLFALSAASAIITMMAQSAGGAVRSTAEFGFSERLVNAIVAYARYLLNLVWPVRLAPMYPHPVNGFPGLQIVFSLLVLGSLTAAVLKCRKHRYLPVGWFWFLGALVPMIGLVQVGEQAMADRYAYLPYVGLFIAICWGVAELAEHKELSVQWLAVPAATVLVALSLLTYRQLGFWKDNLTLWQHTVQVTSANFVAEDNLGGALLTRSRIDEAMPHFQLAAQINPRDPLSRLNLAANMQQKGNLREALNLYQGILDMTSDRGLRATTLDNMGAAYRNLHDYDRAKQAYRDAIQLSPNSPHAWIELGLIAQSMGDLQEAVADYSHATQIEPTDIGLLLTAQALDKSGKTQEAAETRNRAQQISQNFDAAQKSVDLFLSK